MFMFSKLLVQLSKKSLYDNDGGFTYTVIFPKLDNGNGRILNLKRIIF